MSEVEPEKQSRISVSEEKLRAILAEFKEAIDGEIAAVDGRLDKAIAAVTEDIRDTEERLRVEFTDGVHAQGDRMIAATRRQTETIKTIVAESEARNADRITGIQASVTDVARQSPAWEIVIITLLGSALTSAIVDLILAALHLPHLR